MNGQRLNKSLSGFAVTFIAQKLTANDTNNWNLCIPLAPFILKEQFPYSVK